ncbi:MAG: MarR family transcriptional regulator [Solirubrobacteraceae bacterium]
MTVSQFKGKLPELEDISSTAIETDHVDRVLAEWGQARADLDLTPVSVIARLGRTTAYIDAAINARLAEFGLSRGSWDVLASLRRSGEPYRLSPTRLYQALMRTSGAMTHRLYRLERAGLITRLPDPEDGRGLLVQLTPKGAHLVDHVAPAHLSNERSLLAALSLDEQAALANLLRKMLTAFEREQSSPPPSRRRRHRHKTPREPPPPAG